MGQIIVSNLLTAVPVFGEWENESAIILKNRNLTTQYNYLGGLCLLNSFTSPLSLGSWAPNVKLGVNLIHFHVNGPSYNEYLRVHENIIFIGDLMSVMADRRPIGDRHAWSETHLKLTCPNKLFQYTYINEKKSI